MAGLLGGLGAGLQQAGANMHEQTKLQRIQEWQQRVRSEDREFQSQMYDRQRQDAEDDWGRKTEHDEKMARLNASLRPASSSTGTRLPPQATALWNQVEHYRKKMELGDLSPEENAAYQTAMRQYQLWTGTANFGEVPGTQMHADSDEPGQQSEGTVDYNQMANQVRGAEHERRPTGLLGVTPEQAAASPRVMQTIEGRERSNETMRNQIGRFGDRFFNKEMQESEQVAYRRFGDRVPLGNPEWEEWLKGAYPATYQRRVERGEIQP